MTKTIKDITKEEARRMIIAKQIKEDIKKLENCFKQIIDLIYSIDKNKKIC
jgi:hypothetical protein